MAMAAESGSNGQVNNTHNSLTAIKAALSRVIRGKEESIELLLIAVLSGGHVLLEDVPGVGKTTLAKALARAMKMEFKRVQFTPDLLPTDILGSSILNPQDGTFSFQRGPIFTQLLLADEINRASPRTQSALLEAMNEQQVTVDGVTRELDDPFFVIATQNPVDYQGTYPLPEAQLDRFLVRIDLGYPSPEEELNLVFDRQVEDPLDALEPLIDGVALIALQAEVREVKLGRDVGRYLLQLVVATREHPDLELGGSPRGALALFRAAQARAFLSGRDWVGPADVQAVAVPVLAHRLMPTVQARYGGKTTGAIVAEVVARTEVPK
jgi:MoxR-like ATPase